MRRILLLIFVLILVLLPILVLAQEPTVGQVLLDSATDSDEPQFKVLLAAALESGLLSILDDRDADVTVFAPTDEAFYAALEEMGISYSDLTGDTDALIALLTYHVVSGHYSAEALAEETTLPTLYHENTLSISQMDDALLLNETAHIIESDIEAGNGVIHVIDTVLLPPRIITDASPTDIPDTATLADIVGNREDLTTIWAALVAAGFTDALDQSEPVLTLFLPSDAALETAGITADTIGIAQIAYHAVEGRYLLDDLADFDSLTSQEGAEIDIIITNTAMTLNGEAVIVEADIIASNGVIHIIDKPLTVPGTLPATETGGD